MAVQANYIPWTDSSGQVRGLIILVQDVTEQRAAERALRESEERFRRIADQAPTLMWVTGSTGRATSSTTPICNSSAGPARKRTLDWRGRIHPDDHDRIVAESIAGEATRETFTLEGLPQRRGRISLAEEHVLAALRSDGDLAGFIGTATDITVVKEAQLDLKRQVEERTAELARREGSSAPCSKRRWR